VSDIPTSLGALVEDSRRLVAALRRTYGNPPDFDHHIRNALSAFLEVYPPTVRKFTLDAIFGDD
jgi:hypothetical protein